MVQARDPRDQIFALAAGCDATGLDLSAAEGYLLSRIDGSTPWRLLREIGGIPPAEVDDCLTRWVEQGLLDVVGGGAAAGGPDPASAGDATPDGGEPHAASAPADEAPAAPVAIDESALDESLDIGLDVQRRILEFEASLARPYHQLLGIEPGAEPRLVKRAYFKLSKEFHPDRYFRKQIGGYAERLDRIFKKVLEAHEMLSDPELRQVANEAIPPEAPPTDAASVPEATPEQAGAEGASPETPSKPRPLTKLERLRQRMPFKIDHAAIAARRARADEIFRAAQVSQQAGRLTEAEASIRIAISFDPARAEFKEALGSLRIQAAGDRANKLLAKPSERMSGGELLEALRLLEDVLPYRPHDPALNERAARVCLQLGKLADGEEYARTLLERNPESSDAHLLLGRIHKERGDREAATAALEKALKYDGENLEAQRALASLRIGARDAARGGRS